MGSKGLGTGLEKNSVRQKLSSWQQQQKLVLTSENSESWVRKFLFECFEIVAPVLGWPLETAI